MRCLAVFLCFVALTGCAPISAAQEPDAPPVMRWDFHPAGGDWTAETMQALASHGAALPQSVPGDIERWCPGYTDQDFEGRSAFWAGLLSALAKHESTWNPRAVGGGGSWFGLTQIDPRTARGYGCAAQTGEALRDGPANLRCAVRIATAQVTRRGTVGRGMLDWGPFHSETKRADMRQWISAQDYCQADA